MPTSADISVVVQGPIRRCSDGGGYATAEALASLRTHLPDAEIILSTWEGDDVEGLKADLVIQSPDPGALVQAWFRPNNVNRMVCSTAAGLAAATRPLAIKTRTDTLLASDDLLRLALCPPGDPALGLSARIQVTALGTKNPLTTAFQYHPADLVQFGATADLRALWSATPAALEDVFHEPCLTGQFVGPRLSPEQYVCCSFLAHAGLDVPIETTRDLRFAPFATSMRCLLAAFDVFDERKCGIRLPPRMHAIIPSYECISEAGMRSLRAYWRSEPDAARDLHNTMMANMAALQHARDEAGYRTFA